MPSSSSSSPSPPPPLFLLHKTQWSDLLIPSGPTAWISKFSARNLKSRRCVLGCREPLSPPPSANFPAWARRVTECKAKFKVLAENGLRSDEARRCQEIHSWNELEKHCEPSVWELVLEQIEDTLVRILLVAAVISFVLPWYGGDAGGKMGITAFVEPLVIFLILIVNAVVGVWHENNAEKALEGLKEIQSEHATVKRDGKFVPNLPAKELVPSDIVELKVRDKVPADMRVLRLISSTFRV